MKLTYLFCLSVFTLTLAAAFSTPTLAHEGTHGPEQKRAPHGGILRDGPTLMLELIKENNLITIYPLSHEGKSINPQKLKLVKDKTSLKDSKGKVLPLEITQNDTAFLATLKSKESHRYALELTVDYEGKTNKASWQIEWDEN